jgi:hypothetical protein
MTIAGVGAVAAATPAHKPTTQPILVEVVLAVVFLALTLGTVIRSGSVKPSRMTVQRLAWIGSLSVVALTVGAAIGFSFADPNDLGTTVGLSLAGGALLLAAVAAWAATLAYADSLRAPRLEWSLSGPLLESGSHIPARAEVPPLRGDQSAPRGAVFWVFNLDPPLTWLYLRVTNEGDTTARNLLVTLRFVGIRVYADEKMANRWRPDDTDHERFAATFFWDGGTEFSIHPKRTRSIPTIALRQFYLTAKTAPKVHVDVVCDGFDRLDRSTYDLAGIQVLMGDEA